MDALRDVEPASVTDHPIAKSGSVPGIINTCTKYNNASTLNPDLWEMGRKKACYIPFCALCILTVFNILISMHVQTCSMFQGKLKKLYIVALASLKFRISELMNSTASG